MNSFGGGGGVEEQKRKKQQKIVTKRRQISVSGVPTFAKEKSSEENLQLNGKLVEIRLQ